MKVCCISTKDLPVDWLNNTFADTIDIFQKISSDAVCWIERTVAEQDEQYKQLIPYVLVCDSSGVFTCYERQGTESRLHGFYSCGVGGHVDEPDRELSLQATIQNGVQRELQEEFIDFDISRVSLQYRGIIHEVQSEVGKYHLGIVYLAVLEHGYCCLPDSELVGMRWVGLPELSTINLELWSKLALSLL